MTLLADVLDPAELATVVETGLVRRQRHPSLPLSIYNYTEACQYTGAWTPVTLACRGLIVDDAGRVLARPLRKFFNHTEAHAPQADGQVRVTDKSDGSLGIIYHDGTGLAVATRGSFASDQAIHATELLNKRYADFVPPTGRTVLVEIIYPGNRIVVDYAGLDDLVLLGAVDIATGRTYGPEVPEWPGPVVESFDYPTFADALAAPRATAGKGWSFTTLRPTSE
ncbi:RNA ligase [Paractinoplanes durhamensis]|uniref:RNA ligase n=1 Tax=Paractinoplanes durhamensis TaxID=113563 RepID=UPI003637EF92